MKFKYLIRLKMIKIMLYAQQACFLEDHGYAGSDGIAKQFTDTLSDVDSVCTLNTTGLDGVKLPPASSLSDEYKNIDDFLIRG